ncbi:MULTISPECIES: RraA family protein [Streptomyces]|uniref:RraA family protein n=1 Tax=Streptomyces decoyicus TaxID=249567 RepID=UPI002E187E08|nr:RraA family protein [Streptomyces decoyicus]
MTVKRHQDEVWPTAALWDAGIRLGHRLRLPPRPLLPAAPGMRLTGPLRPIRHTEGVVSILEGLDSAHEGDVLLIDNDGRMDEACVGDLVAIEARLAGIAGLVVWGCHRDTDELAVIGLPVFSLGPCPASPTLRPVPGGQGPGAFEVRAGDVAGGDSDGLVIVPADVHKEVVDVAQAIVQAEQRQADRVLGGVSLREQLHWEQFRERRRAEPSYTFRDHLSQVSGALE